MEQSLIVQNRPGIVLFLKFSILSSAFRLHYLQLFETLEISSIAPSLFEVVRHNLAIIVFELFLELMSLDPLVAPIQ